MSITSGSHCCRSDDDEECRLRALMAQDPPQVPYHGVYVRKANGQAGGEPTFALCQATLT